MYFYFPSIQVDSVYDPYFETGSSGEEEPHRVANRKRNQVEY